MKQKLLKSFTWRATLLVAMLMGVCSSICVAEEVHRIKSISDLVQAGILKADECTTSFKVDDYLTFSTSGSVNNQCGLTSTAGNNKVWYPRKGSDGDLTISVPNGYELKSVKLVYQSTSVVIKYGETTISSNQFFSVEGSSITLTSTANQFRIVSFEVIYKTPSFVTLNEYGYATYANDAAVDFSKEATQGKYTAWQITGISGSTIEFLQVNCPIASRNAVLLKGTPNGTADITQGEGNTNLHQNLLKGSFYSDPISVSYNGEYYGLSGDQFVPVNVGRIPAGKAVLLASGFVDDVKTLNFVFEGADGIKHVETVSSEQAAEIFNLAGQRLQKAQKGVNIVNGKKVLIK